MSSQVLENSSEVENILKVRCHRCDHRIIVENPVPLDSCKCPDCGVSFIIPLQIGHFILESLISDDGVIANYRGTDRKLNRQLVIKLVKSEYVNSEAMYNIGIGAFTHANAGTIFGTEMVDGSLLLLTEHIDGHNLDFHIKNGQKLEINSVISMAKDIADLLKASSEAGIHHGHLSLDSIWVNGEGEIKVADFFIRQKVRENYSEDISDKVLNRHYFKDVRSSQSDEATDLYSLGACLYKLTTENFPDSGVVAPNSVNEEVPDYFSEIIVDLLNSTIGSFSDVLVRLEEGTKPKKVAQKKKTEPSIKVATQANIQISADSTSTQSLQKKSNRDRKAILQVKHLRNQLLLSRILALSFLVLLILFTASRYMPESGIGKNSEKILNKTLDKMFGGEKDKFDLDEIINDQ